MKSMRYLIASLFGIAAGAGLLYGIGRFGEGGSGLTGEGGLPDGLYSSMVIYPAAVLVFAAVFWILFAAMDPGSEK